MNQAVKKVTLNISVNKLEKAMELVALNKTDTINLALEELIKLRKQNELKKFRGKINLDLDIGIIRSKDSI